jgi:hypothetical protein
MLDPSDADVVVINAEGGVTESTFPVPITTRSVLREIRKELLGSALDAEEGRMCSAVAADLDKAATREEAARASGRVGARARPTADNTFRHRPRRLVVLEVCERLGLEPPYDARSLDKLLTRARRRRERILIVRGLRGVL